MDDSTTDDRQHQKRPYAKPQSRGPLRPEEAVPRRCKTSSGSGPAQFRCTIARQLQRDDIVGVEREESRDIPPFDTFLSVGGITVTSSPRSPASRRARRGARTGSRRRRPR